MHTIKRIRTLKAGEEYWPAYAGEYTTGDGKAYFLDNPAAETIASLYNLKTAELQFEFFCFAYLWRYRDMLFYSKNDEHKLAFDRYMKLQGKFKAPWYQQAKYVLPIESPRIRPFTDQGDLDLDEVEKVFDECADCDFIVYRVPLYDDPEWARRGVEPTPLRETQTES
jgi:hypothetical protein